MDTLFVYAAKDPNGGRGVIQSKNSLLFESHGGELSGDFYTCSNLYVYLSVDKNNGSQMH